MFLSSGVDRAVDWRSRTPPPSPSHPWVTTLCTDAGISHARHEYVGGGGSGGLQKSLRRLMPRNCKRKPQHGRSLGTEACSSGGRLLRLDMPPPPPNSDTRWGA